MGHNGDRLPWDENPKEHMGMMEMGPQETNTPWGTVGADPHGMKTPKSIWEWWGRVPMRPRAQMAQWGHIPMG